MPKCPGQDPRNWKPDDVFEMVCPYCTRHIEMWKDDPKRVCPGCNMEVRNPRIDTGCAKWCKFADQCLGKEVQDADEKDNND